MYLKLIQLFFCAQGFCPDMYSYQMAAGKLSFPSQLILMKSLICKRKRFQYIFKRRWLLKPGSFNLDVICAIFFGKKIA